MTETLTRPVPAFGGNRIDRMDVLRADADGLAVTIADPSARLVLLDGLDPVVTGDRLATRPLPADSDPAGLLLIGKDDEGPLFAPIAPSTLPHGASFGADLWQAASALAPDQLALYGAARALVDWHARHGFCAQCGGRTAPVRAGWSRRCDGCGAEHFPRVDPVAIMLAEHEGRVLVGRQPRFPPRQYSALAGFIEPGETIEEAVARELMEEAGVRVTAVRYVMSQPWPFPSSLMIACIAQVAHDAITLDRNELEDAIWVDRAGVTAAFARTDDAPFLAPQPIAVAHHLLRHWLEE